MVGIVLPHWCGVVDRQLSRFSAEEPRKWLANLGGKHRASDQRVFVKDSYYESSLEEAQIVNEEFRIK
jgi:hypothetical protein